MRTVFIFICPSSISRLFQRMPKKIVMKHVQHRVWSANVTDLLYLTYFVGRKNAQKRIS